MYHGFFFLQKKKKVTASLVHLALMSLLFSPHLPATWSFPKHLILTNSTYLSTVSVLYVCSTVSVSIHKRTCSLEVWLTDWLCSKHKRWSFYDESALVSDRDPSRQGECIEWSEINFYDLETASSSGMLHVPNRSLRIPTGNVFEPGIETWRRIETRTTEFTNTDSTIFQQPRCLEFHASCWRNLFSKLCDGKPVICFLGFAFRKFPRPRLLPALESQLQERSAREHIYSWTHFVVDQ